MKNRKDTEQDQKGANNNKGFVVRLKNLHFLLGMPNNDKDIQFKVVLYVSERDPTVLNETLLKDIADAGLYYKNIAVGNVI